MGLKNNIKGKLNFNRKKTYFKKFSSTFNHQNFPKYLFGYAILFLIIGASVFFAGSDIRNQEVFGQKLLLYLPHFNKDSLPKTLSEWQTSSGGLSLLGEENGESIDSTYKTMKILQIYGYYLSPDHVSPHKVDKNEISNFIMNKYKICGFSKDEFSEPDIINTAKAIEILDMLGDKEKLELIKKEGTATWIKEFLGYDVDWQRLLSENIEPKYWGVKALKILEGEKGLEAVGLDYLSLKNILSQDEYVKERETILTNNSLHLIWEHPYYYNEEEVSIIPPSEDNVRNYYYAVLLLDELIEDETQKEAVFDMLINKGDFAKVFKEETKYNSSIEGFRDLSQGYYAISSLNILRESDFLYQEINDTKLCYNNFRASRC